MINIGIQNLLSKVIWERRFFELIQSYSDFLRFISDNPISIDYVESDSSKQNPYFIYKEGTQTDTYLSVSYYGTVGKIDAFELVYINSEVVDFHKMLLYIQHFIIFLKQCYTKNKKSFVVFKRAESKKSIEENDMIYVHLMNVFKPLGADELTLLLGNSRTIQYCFQFLQDNSFQLLIQTFSTLNEIQCLTDRKILRSLIQTHYINNSETDYFLHFYFMYGHHRLNLTIKKRIPIEFEIRFAFGDGFSSHSFYFREHRCLENAIKALLEMNKLKLLFEEEM